MLFLVIVMMTCLSVKADGNTVTKLRAEMLRYISTPDRAKFTEVTEQLKTLSLEEGDERTFYTAWCNQAIYEATHQFYVRASEIADEIEEYAEDQNSHFGKYSALHARAMIALQKQDYDEAEPAFQKAVDYRHHYFPKESAGDDLQELMKIANHRNDAKAGEMYARQILAEPDVAPIHKGRALFRLSQMAFKRNNKEQYDSIYAVLQELKRTDGISAIEPIVEVNYNIINENYQEALALCKDLAPEKRAERMALIYHRMGDNDKAYEYMAKFKKINDSIVLVSHGNVVASCYVQMNNERMKLEQNLLEAENRALQQKFIYTLVAAIIIILGMIIYQRQRRVKYLQWDNAALARARQRAEKELDVKNEFLSNITSELRAPLNPITGFSDILGTAEYELQPEERVAMSQHIKHSSKKLTKLIDEMAELSYYESKKTLPLTVCFSPNHLLNHMADSMKVLCKDGVDIVVESTMSDNQECETNLEAMEHLLKHLLENAIQNTDHGTITLGCDEKENMIHVSVTDTGYGISANRRMGIVELLDKDEADASTSSMGLAICKAIVKHLGGRIWLDTDYLAGARFVFEVPKEYGQHK